MKGYGLRGRLSIIWMTSASPAPPVTRQATVPGGLVEAAFDGLLGAPP